MVGRVAVLAVAFVGLLVGSSFAVPVGGGADARPVPYEDTVSLGLTSTALRQADSPGVVLPKVEAFYSEYEFVIGYYGIESYVSEHARTGHDRQFGQPVAVFVTDYAGGDVSLDADGYPVSANGTALPFVRASETYVVVGSRARTADGPLAIPFSEREAARAFAAEYGGEVVPWERVHDAVDSTGTLSRDRFESAVAERSAWADRAVESTRGFRDRPVSVTVGEDAPTLAAAVEAAPPNTTILLPAGVYHVDGLTVDSAVTIAGVGPETRLRGDGNGTVVRVTAARAALVDLSIDGVGAVGSPERPANGSAGWSESVELAYGRGDAAIRLDGADGALVEDVRIDTPASGVVTREAHGAVVRNLTLRGAATPEDGFMGVVAMYAPVVVEDSRFTGGRDGVYTHRAHGSVIRDNEFRDARFGVHLMYTSRTLVADNEIHDQTIGVVIMTRPTGNLIVGNTVTGARTGIATVGSDSYYAENILVDNKWGMTVSGTGSLYTRNTVVGNTYGLRGSSLLPTNHVTHNDVVDNARPADSSLGTLRVWTTDGQGNYWGTVPGVDRDGDGYGERAFRPTGPIDSQVQTTTGAWTLAHSPAVALTRGLGGAVPGLRATGVVDTAPRLTPVRPAVLAAARANDTATEPEVES
ncbi:NosD domain-containing protein [Halobaculum marinum]|uniref:NosD domain-containing protein n=1 Tax=Halobaculum marinum TaxID=3031996 RepID=A0ABD5WVH2_9EURY|nr:NosD domain-containing protein [Halobaculum sp. DT55]